MEWWSSSWSWWIFAGRYSLRASGESLNPVAKRKKRSKSNDGESVAVAMTVAVEELIIDIIGALPRRKNLDRRNDGVHNSITNLWCLRLDLAYIQDIVSNVIYNLNRMPSRKHTSTGERAVNFSHIVKFWMCRDWFLVGLLRRVERNQSNVGAMYFGWWIPKPWHSVGWWGLEGRKSHTGKQSFVKISGKG